MPEVFSLASGEERPSERVVLLNSVAPNEKKTSGTQGNLSVVLHTEHKFVANLYFH